jgi:uncharacterized membrane protein YeaQ/YmgE (transglycosylase-associated protein family)
VGIIAWIVLGAIAGFIASLIMGAREGVILMVVLGIVGALVGGYIAGTLLHAADVTGLNVESIVVAVIGAIVVIALLLLGAAAIAFGEDSRDSVDDVRQRMTPLV